MALFIICSLFFYFSSVKLKNGYANELLSYKKNCEKDAKITAKNIEDKFNTIYVNIRTIAFLPSIRSIDRNAKNLSEDAKSSIQQIYNNLSTAIAVSEVYVIDEKFDPNNKKNLKNLQFHSINLLHHLKTLKQKSL